MYEKGSRCRRGVYLYVHHFYIVIEYSFQLITQNVYLSISQCVVFSFLVIT